MASGGAEGALRAQGNETSAVRGMEALALYVLSSRVDVVPSVASALSSLRVGSLPRWVQREQRTRESGDIKKPWLSFGAM